jgi:hypothetical protein
MKDVIYLLFDLLATVAKLLRPSGSRTVVAENLCLKQQLIAHSLRQVQLMQMALPPYTPFIHIAADNLSENFKQITKGARLYYLMHALMSIYLKISSTQPGWNTSSLALES